MRGSDAIVRMLIAHGVEYVFGVPGDTSMNFHDAFSQATDKITHVTCRDERSAAFMADGYARVRGKPGVVEVPSGGGALYVVPGVSEANVSSIPLICLSSDITMSSEETNALTDANQEYLFKTITKWNCKIRDASKIPQLLRKAFRMATGGIPGAVHVSVPENIHALEVDFSPEALRGSQYTAHKCPFKNEPDAEDIGKAVKMFLKASRPVIIAGGGVHLSSAYEELEQFCDEFRVPVATSVNGKGSIQEFSPYAVGVIGANGGSEETNNIVYESDLVLVLGSKLNNVTTMGKAVFNDTVKIIQVDIGEEVLDHNVPVDLPVLSDIRSFLTKLKSAMQAAKEKFVGKFDEWNRYIQKKVKEKRSRIETESKIENENVHPAKIFTVLEQVTDDNTIFVADAGTPTPYLASYLRVKKAGRNTIMPRGHGGLGYALPAAIGAKLAKPEVTVIALFGDGSFGMSVGELETAKRLGLPIVFINFQNHSYGWIKTIQRLYYNKNYFAVDFTPIDAVKIAEGFGIKGKCIESNSDLEEGIKWAISQNSPVLLDIMIEPPTKVIPPVLKWERDSKIPPAKRKKLTY